MFTSHMMWQLHCTEPESNMLYFHFVILYDWTLNYPIYFYSTSTVSFWFIEPIYLIFLSFEQ